MVEFGTTGHLLLSGDGTWVRLGVWVIMVLE